RFSRDWSSDVCSSDLLYWAQTYYRFKGTNDVEYELFGSDEWTEKESIDWIAFKQQFFSSVLSFPEGFQNPTGGSTPIDQEVDPRSEERRVGNECRCR